MSEEQRGKQALWAIVIVMIVLAVILVGAIQSYSTTTKQVEAQTNALQTIRIAAEDAKAAASKEMKAWKELEMAVKVREDAVAERESAVEAREKTVATAEVDLAGTLDSLAAARAELEDLEFQVEIERSELEDVRDELDATTLNLENSQHELALLDETLNSRRVTIIGLIEDLQMWLDVAAEPDEVEIVDGDLLIEEIIEP